MAASLTDRQRRFVGEYLIDLNATQAAVRAGYSAKTAEQQAYQLLQKPSVQAAIQAAQNKRSERTAITQDRVLLELWGIATADANELVEHRVSCCRFCWGRDFLFQRTPNETRVARADYERFLVETTKGEGTTPLPEFDEAGGDGFNATREPNPKCPECFGEGNGRPVFHDSRIASDGAKALYAGVKVTRDGMEMRLHDKTKALELVGRHLGMFKERHEHSGPGGGAIPVDATVRAAEVRAQVLGLLAAPKGSEQP